MQPASRKCDWNDRTCSPLSGSWPNMLRKARARYCRTQLHADYARTHAGPYEEIGLGKFRCSKKQWRLREKRPFRKVTLPVSLADGNQLKNIPWKIFSACMKFGGSRCRDVETHSGQTDTRTHIHTHARTHARTHTYLNEIMY